ncbi:hypothetical protein NMY22_g15305 [Coprinellus aureogranulatus]|nr:hypothetical protein NMY22_g15305 [Coprinellus aureogranulatus]
MSTPPVYAVHSTSITASDRRFSTEYVRLPSTDLSIPSTKDAAISLAEGTSVLGGKDSAAYYYDEPVSSAGPSLWTPQAFMGRVGSPWANGLHRRTGNKNSRQPPSRSSSGLPVPPDSANFGKGLHAPHSHSIRLSIRDSRPASSQYPKANDLSALESQLKEILDLSLPKGGTPEMPLYALKNISLEQTVQEGKTIVDRAESWMTPLPKSLNSNTSAPKVIYASRCVRDTVIALQTYIAKHTDVEGVTEAQAMEVRPGVPFIDPPSSQPSTPPFDIAKADAQMPLTFWDQVPLDPVGPCTTLPKALRHGTPSDPWPWLEIGDDIVPRTELNYNEDDASREPVPVPCTHSDVSCSSQCWRQYPQALYPNWTKAQLRSSGILGMIESEPPTSSHTILRCRLLDGLLLDAGDLYIPTGANSVEEAWMLVKSELMHTSEDTRVTMIFLQDLWGPIVQMLGALWNVNPTFFSNSINWVPSRFHHEVKGNTCDRRDMVVYLSGGNHLRLGELTEHQPARAEAIRAYQVHCLSALDDFSDQIAFVRRASNPFTGGDQPRMRENDRMVQAESEALLYEIEKLKRRLRLQEEILSIGFHRLDQLAALHSKSHTEAALEESIAMKQIARLTTVFLPAGFIAAVFGMNVNELSSETKGSLWQYFAVALPLTFLALRAMSAMEHSFKLDAKFWIHFAGPLGAMYERRAETKPETEAERWEMQMKKFIDDP